MITVGEQMCDADDVRLVHAQMNGLWVSALRPLPLGALEERWTQTENCRRLELIEDGDVIGMWTESIRS